MFVLKFVVLYFLLTYGLCMVILWLLHGFTYKVLFKK